MKFNPEKMRNECECGSVAFALTPIYKKLASGQEVKIGHVHTCKDCNKSYEVRNG